MCHLCLMGIEFWDPTHVRAQTPSPPPATVTPPSGGIVIRGAQPAPAGGFGGFAPMAPVNTAGPSGPPITVVNGTKDPRIVWEDGHIAILYAKDFPANTGMGRSKTRDDVKDAINAVIDDTLQSAPGAGSLHKFVKVRLSEILARPLPAGPAPVARGRLPIDPSQFKPVAPKIAKSGSYAGQIIPDYPHDCTACGGKFYQGMFGGIHPTPDGKCPAESRVLKPPRRK